MGMGNGVYYVSCATGAQNWSELERQQVSVHNALSESIFERCPRASLVLAGSAGYASYGASKLKPIENSVLYSANGIVVSRFIDDGEGADYPTAIVLASRSLEDLQAAFELSKQHMGEAAFKPIDASPEFLQRAKIEIRPS
ncbi:MAG: hypothetical protein AB7G06_03220 [Bdellovibrionales bacterium]